MIQADPIRMATRAGTRVALRLWGFTAADLDRAFSLAGMSPGAHHWNVVEVDRASGLPCAIDSNDRGALDQGADYHCAWAAYTLGKRVRT
jgi:hypothetical protein